MIDVSFTDSDLKRLKEDAANEVWPIISRETALALIARLECAEAVIKESFQPDGMAYIVYDSWHEAYEAWRKAKGE